MSSYWAAQTTYSGTQRLHTGAINLSHRDGRDPNATFEDLRAMHEEVVRAGAVSIVVTVPETKLEVTQTSVSAHIHSHSMYNKGEEGEEARRTLNPKLR